MKTILTIIAAILFAWFLARTSLGQVAQPHGYYVMTSVGGMNVQDGVLGNPALSGLLIRDSWSAGFAYLDVQLAHAKRLSKQVTIGVYMGQNGHQPKHWTWADVDSEIAAQGARWNLDPSVIAVHIGCPDTLDSMEMYSPPKISDAQLITDWKRCIDDYSNAFPSKALILDVAMAGASKHATTTAIVSYAESKLGQRFNAIMDSLHATTSTGYQPYQIVKAAGTSGFNTGFEMVGPSTDQSRFGGKFSTALSIGNAAGAKWYQIYQADVVNLPKGLHAGATPEPPTIIAAIESIMLVALIVRWERKHGRLRNRGSQTRAHPESRAIGRRGMVGSRLALHRLENRGQRLDCELHERRSHVRQRQTRSRIG